MKMKRRQFYNSMTSIMLALCMIFSCVTVGLVPTNAARVEGESVGTITEIQLRGSFNGWSSTANTASSFPEASWGISLTGNVNYQFKVVFEENGSHFCGITDNNDGTYSSLGNSAELIWDKGGNVNFKPSDTAVYVFTVTTNNGKNYITITKSTEAIYAVTVNNGDHGTVSPNSVNAGVTCGYDLSNITVTPVEGYSHSGWTASGNATISNGKVIPAGEGASVTPTYTAVSYVLRYETITNSNGNNFWLDSYNVFSSPDSNNDREVEVDVGADGIYLFVATTDANKTNGTYFKHATDDKTEIKTNQGVILTKYPHNENWGGLAGKVKFIPPSNQTGPYIFKFNPQSGSLTVRRGTVTINNLSVSKSVTGTDSSSLTVQISSATGTNTGGVTVTATNGDSGQYTFTGWTSLYGSFADANSLQTTFYPYADDATAVAHFTEKSYTITVAKDSHGQAVTPSNISVHPYTSTNLSDVITEVTPKTGYQFSGWTASNGITLTGDSSTDHTVGAINATQEGTLTANFSEITHTVKVYRRFYKADGTSLISQDLEGNPVQTITGVGIDTQQTVNAAPTVENYTFSKFSKDSYVTVKSGSLNTADSFAITSTADTSIYIDYVETVYNIIVSVTHDGSHVYGDINRSNSSLTGNTGTGTTSIGNVTEVTLTAANRTGYTFTKWQITKDTATKVYVDGTEQTGTGTIEIMSGISHSFKFNGTATVTAVFTPTQLSLTASFATTYSPGNVVKITDPSGDDKSSGKIYDPYIVEVTLDPGYEIDSVAINESNTSVTPESSTVNGKEVKKYSLTINDANNISAVVTLKAETPSITNVQIIDTTIGYVDYSSEYNVPHYYMQPLVAHANTQSYATLNYQSSKNENTVIDSETGKASEVEVTLDPSADVIPTTETGTVTYKFKITAVNEKMGVQTVTVEKNYTISVSFNDAQKYYFRLNKLFGRCIRENVSDNNYYLYDAPIGEYNTAYDNAQTFIADGYPTYNATVTAAQTEYNNFEAKWKNLQAKAKTTTIYVLSQYSRSDLSYVNVLMCSNGTNIDTLNDDYKHFKMSDFESFNTSTSQISEDDLRRFHMTYDGTVTKSGTTYYRYKFTYAGHAQFYVWRGSSSTDINDSTAKQLTGIVSAVTDFGEYYLNLYSTQTGTQTAYNNPLHKYVDFGHNYAKKQGVNPGDTLNSSQLLDLFGISTKGSMISLASERDITMSNTTFTITGPLGAAQQTTVYMNANNASFTAANQGKYKIVYTTVFGTKANGDNETRTAEMTLYVYDDISIYVDMNDNVGTPVLNFKYWKKNEAPVAAGTSDATVAFLPCEMDLVSGSESVYKYTIKISKLRDTYHINLEVGSNIKISFITVEDYYINKNGKSTIAPTGTDIDTYALEVGTEAKISGEIWFKADSTNMTKFETISYGSVENQFLAINTSHNILSSGIKSITGTAIHTDESDIYHTQYAAYDDDYSLDKFRYVVNASANSEIDLSGTEYYFDKWIRFPTPEGGLSISTSSVTEVRTLTLPANTDYSLKEDMTFTEAPEYDDGNFTYVAVYKQAIQNDSTVRVQVTYNFRDYDTSDGNEIYDPLKDTVAASYTKIIKVKVGSGQTYADFAAVNAAAAIDQICQDNAPYIRSNYFDYRYEANSSAIGTSIEGESKIIATATMTHIAEGAPGVTDQSYGYYVGRNYSIVVKNGANTYTKINGSTGDDMVGKYQQTVTLDSANFGNPSNPVWTDDNGKVLAVGQTFKARYFSSKVGAAGTSDNVQVIKLISDASVTATPKSSVIENAATTVDNSGTTTKLHHNFYIVDYCTEGELVGGGVLFATTDSIGNYRQIKAGTNLADETSRRNFINGILGGDYETEYSAQTIDNTGFRYKPFKSNEDVYHYSNDLSAYLTIFEATNTNSSSYAGQKLRMFSYMVYKTVSGGNTTYTTVPSEGYVEVERYINV